MWEVRKHSNLKFAFTTRLTEIKDGKSPYYRSIVKIQYVLRCGTMKGCGRRQHSDCFDKPMLKTFALNSNNRIFTGPLNRLV